MEKKISNIKLNDSFIPLPQNNKGIISLVKNAKDGLFEGLNAVEYKDGWFDPTNEIGQGFWTSLEVLKSLVEMDFYPDNFDTIINNIQKSKKTIEGLVGWEYEGFEDHISIYVTGDVIKLFLVLKKYNDIKELIISLQNMQNNDGGWGVCKGDNVSRVRSTSWVLSVLFECINFKYLLDSINENTISKGLNWLYIAQNDVENDYGWGNLPDTLPSNVSATVFALNALLDATICSSKNNLNFIQIRYDAIRRGLDKLISMKIGEHWQGLKEESAINLNQNMIRRHIIGGAGTTCAVQVFIKAHKAEILKWPDENLYHGLINLIKRCKSYHKKGGKWLIPADDDGPPLTWNSAYALDALNMFEKFYFNNVADKWLEKSIYNNLTKTLRFWRITSIVLLLTLIVIIISPQLKSLSKITLWFANLSVLFQGIIMMVITLIFERLYSRISKSIIKRMQSNSNKFS